MTDKSNKQERNEQIMNDILSKIKKAWNSPIVLRKDIAKFSFGLVTVRTMQTLDSRGDGIRTSMVRLHIA